MMYLGGSMYKTDYFDKNFNIIHHKKIIKSTIELNIDLKLDL